MMSLSVSGCKTFSRASARSSSLCTTQRPNTLAHILPFLSEMVLQNVSKCLINSARSFLRCCATASQKTSCPSRRRRLLVLDAGRDGGE